MNPLIAPSSLSAKNYFGNFLFSPCSRLLGSPSSQKKFLPLGAFCREIVASLFIPSSRCCSSVPKRADACANLLVDRRVDPSWYCRPYQLESPCLLIFPLPRFICPFTHSYELAALLFFPCVSAASILFCMSEKRFVLLSVFP